MNASAMTKKKLIPVEERVLASLQRVGYQNFQVIHHGDGEVEVTGTSASANDRAIAIAIARSVPGVRSVTYSVK